MFILAESQFRHEIRSALDDFKSSITYEIETSNCDNQTCELVQEIAKQTFYALGRFAEIVEKHLN